MSLNFCLWFLVSQNCDSEPLEPRNTGKNKSVSKTMSWDTFTVFGGGIVFFSFFSLLHTWEICPRWQIFDVHSFSVNNCIYFIAEMNYHLSLRMLSSIMFLLNNDEKWRLWQVYIWERFKGRMRLRLFFFKFHSYNFAHLFSKYSWTTCFVSA